MNGLRGVMTATIVRGTEDWTDCALNRMHVQPQMAHARLGAVREHFVGALQALEGLHIAASFVWV